MHLIGDIPLILYRSTDGSAEDADDAINLWIPIFVGDFSLQIILVSSNGGITNSY